MQAVLGLACIFSPSGSRAWTGPVIPSACSNPGRNLLAVAPPSHDRSSFLLQTVNDLDRFLQFGVPAFPQCLARQVSGNRRTDAAIFQHPPLPR